jgi:membrane protein DedA with SNARE-associated domain
VAQAETVQLASLTSQLTGAVSHHGALAVFLLMAVDAVLPAGSELVMLFAGAVIASGFAGYVGVSAAGTVGYLAGSLAGWAIGWRGGRPLIERHGRLLHLPPPRMRRAEAWFRSYGLWAVFLGRVTPLARSFISIPAGAFGIPLAPYTLLTLAGSAIWCFALAGAGYAVGGSWETVHHAFRYADYAVVVLVVAVLAGLLWHRRRRAVTAGP